MSIGVYRDSYYTYYASKLDEFSRDCARISFFTEKIDAADFISAARHEAINEAYVGFAVLRPINNGNPGRSALSPKAFKFHDFICELTSIRANIRGVKLKVKCRIQNTGHYRSEKSESRTCCCRYRP